jgi:RNA polymerase sigma factor (sigma-70 family)
MWLLGSGIVSVGTTRSIPVVRENRIGVSDVLINESCLQRPRVKKSYMRTRLSYASTCTQETNDNCAVGTTRRETTVHVTASTRMDPALLAAFQRGEPRGVRAIYREYGGLVYAVAHHVLGEHGLAEEAAQQTFVRAWQTADRFDIDREPAAWLATIAKRIAIDIYRREARRPASALADVAANDPAIVSLPPDLDTLDAVWHVRRAIDALPSEEALIVRLHHLDGLTHHEISKELGIALGTVKSRSHRAHRRLAALLGHLRSRPHE